MNYNYTLKEYIKRLNRLIKENPNAILIHSTDEEGNDFQEVFLVPTLGFYDSDKNGIDKFINENECIRQNKQPNAICVN